MIPGELTKDPTGEKLATAKTKMNVDSPVTDNAHQLLKHSSVTGKV